MQAQRYFTNFCLKISVFSRVCFARFVVPGSALVLAVAAVTFVPHLAKDVRTATTILSHAMGYAHATLSAIQHVIAENPWPNPSSTSSFV
jgi:hypothetical protein